MRVSTRTHLMPGEVELGVVHATRREAEEDTFQEVLEDLIHRAAELGATGLIGLQLVQSQFQWNQRTSLVATAVRVDVEAADHLRASGAG